MNGIERVAASWARTREGQHLGMVDAVLNNRNGGRRRREPTLASEYLLGTVTERPQVKVRRGWLESTRSHHPQRR